MSENKTATYLTKIGSGEIYHTSFDSALRVAKEEARCRPRIVQIYKLVAEVKSEVAPAEVTMMGDEQ